MIPLLIGSLKLVLIDALSFFSFSGVNANLSWGGGYRRGYKEGCYNKKQLLRLFMVTTFMKKQAILWISFGRDTLYLCSTAALPLSRPWYWQGWHQRRALTLGELGLPAVSNQVYFEVRDTWTPRARAATRPPHSHPAPSPNLAYNFQTPCSHR